MCFLCALPVAGSSNMRRVCTFELGQKILAQYLLKMGGQLDKRMLHRQPATCIFSCSLLSVIWRIKYYYYYYYSVLKDPKTGH